MRCPMTNNLSGRALAEAAAKVMGWVGTPHCYALPGGVFLHGYEPDQDGHDDWLCLQHATENWRDIQSTETGRAWVRFQNALQRECPRSWDYTRGAYARALVAAAGEGE